MCRSGWNWVQESGIHVPILPCRRHHPSIVGSIGSTPELDLVKMRSESVLQCISASHSLLLE